MTNHFFTNQTIGNFMLEVALFGKILTHEARTELQGLYQTIGREKLVELMTIQPEHVEEKLEQFLLEANENGQNN